MDETTLKALNGSIAKWQAIVDGTGADDGSQNCPLCQLFNQPAARCSGCPVAHATGSWGCDDTPYQQWDDGGSDVADTPELKLLAQAELDFLRGLLPTPVAHSK